MNERDQSVKYFGLWRGETHKMSEMKVATSNINSLIRGGVLYGQFTLDGDMEVRRVRQRREEPVDLGT